MSAARRALAREKETLLMRSTLARLRLRLAIQRAHASPAARLASRIAFFGRLARVVAAAPGPFAATLHELGEDIRALHESQ